LEKLEQAIFQLVLHGGNARAKAYEALDAAEHFDFEAAERRLAEAEEELQQGHRWQTELIQSMEQAPPSFLAIHAQDHVMTALAELNLVKRLVRAYRTLDELARRLAALEEGNGEQAAQD